MTRWIAFAIAVLTIAPFAYIPFALIGYTERSDDHSASTKYLTLVGALFVLALAWNLRAYRRDRKFALARSHRCTECGYDLRATTGRCPECGSTPKFTTGIPN